jgi:hypothetical protein
MHRRALWYSLAAALLGACGPRVLTTPVPTPDPGARIRFQTPSSGGDYVVGRLVSLGPDSMVFEQRIPGENGFTWAPASLVADSIVQLQVRVGRKGKAVPGAMIGGAIGFGLGLLCVSEEGGFVTDEECLAGYALLGTGTGLLIGALVRTDVWAPTSVPRGSEKPVPVVTVAPTRLGLRIPFRLPNR